MDNIVNGWTVTFIVNISLLEYIYTLTYTFSIVSVIVDNITNNRNLFNFTHVENQEP